MIPNPKRQMTVDFSKDQVKNAIIKIPNINNKYKIESSNDVFRQFTLESYEFLSLGVYIDITYKSITDNSTEITVEVRRKVGSFDKSHEVSTANEHIQQLIRDLSKLLTNPDLEIYPVEYTKSDSKSNYFQKTLSVFAWLIGILSLITIFIGNSTNPITIILHIIIFIALINKSIRKLFKSVGYIWMILSVILFLFFIFFLRNSLTGPTKKQIDRNREIKDSIELVINNYNRK